MRLKLISCEVFHREMAATVSRSVHQVDIELLPQGLHNLGCHRMSKRLQAVVDGIRGHTYDAVLLGYGLCGNGLIGLTARSTQLVLPRAHDCITLFLGSKERYREYFDNHPGVYYRTTGWLERVGPEQRDGQFQLGAAEGAGARYEELVTRYGEEDAKEIMDVLSGQASHYGQITFIEMGVEPDGSFERRAEQEASDKGWKFENVKGDMSLIRELVNGPWNNEKFLTVPPGHKIAPLYNTAIIKSVPAE